MLTRLASTDEQCREPQQHQQRGLGNHGAEAAEATIRIMIIFRQRSVVTHPVRFGRAQIIAAASFRECTEDETADVAKRLRRIGQPAGNRVAGFLTLPTM